MATQRHALDEQLPDWGSGRYLTVTLAATCHLREMLTHLYVLVPVLGDEKLLRKLMGCNVRISHGLAQSLAQLDQETPEFRERVGQFFDGLVSHYVLDGGRLVVAHAGMKEELQGRASSRVRAFALYGETTGETDDFGLPVRYNWAQEYRGKAVVVYGHTPVAEPEWLNHTINVDTGCVFGGKLTALRYPERELVSSPAAQTYYQPARPFLPEGSQAAAPTARRPSDDLLDVEDVVGKRFISTRLYWNVTIRGMVQKHVDSLTAAKH